MAEYGQETHKLQVNLEAGFGACFVSIMKSRTCTHTYAVRIEKIGKRDRTTHPVKLSSIVCYYLTTSK
ncbi:hypothetical protein [Myxosarcina sp. GI1]|uniref:hypothetical protein n=1 Tax=Myxosarcina sp. GI1 TaxID=1541065 RepID=UPI0012E0696D|nr:hypothetical protein [Myxosarcina sp. GI1]